ncbi:hypothetical protein ACS5PK_01845 [Roseateles sp. DB2]|uniref:hypothetical protein n=1 Tax=Roseateles sp. DB2 TaxID=3453717 RepID=UPI003EEDFF05
MKSNERTLAPVAPLQRQAAAHAGAGAAADTPRQLAQGAQIAQLMDGERKASGHALGPSHSKTGPTGKTRSHKPGKGRTEKPSISAAKNNKRRRQMQNNVSNSIAKDKQK